MDVLKDIAKEALKAAPIEKCFLLAKRKISSETESLFIPSCHKATPFYHYYILVLLPKEHQCDHFTVQERVELYCRTIAPVTALAMDMEIFNEWLFAGHPFAVPVKLNGQILFDRKVVAFSDIGQLNAKRHIVERTFIYQEGLNEITELIQKDKLNDAASYGLKSILKAVLQIDFATNDINKLLDYCSIIIQDIPRLFPNSDYNRYPPVQKIEALLHSLDSANKLLRLNE